MKKNELIYYYNEQKVPFRGFRGRGITSLPPMSSLSTVLYFPHI